EAQPVQQYLVVSALGIAELVEDVGERRASPLGGLPVEHVEDRSCKQGARRVLEVAGIALRGLPVGVHDHASDALSIGNFVRSTQADGRERIECGGLRGGRREVEFKNALTDASAPPGRLDVVL